MSLFQPVPLFKEQGFHSQVYLSTKVTDNFANYRAVIRQALCEALTKQKIEFDQNTLLDLKHPPQTPQASLSISHGQKGSLFAILNQQGLTGVDIEDLNRLTPAIIQRVATNKEQQQAPNPQYLFSAKEATWKAINQKLSIPVISQIEIYHWQQVSSQVFLYECQHQQKAILGQGMIYLEDSLQMSLFETT